MTRLRDFLVLKKLSVTDLTVEARRVKATYTVEHFNGEKAATELIYSYDNPYFNPANGNDVNLASVMAVQVALNYGLFCEEIVFDGLYDQTDRQFLRYVLENTSREILCNKLLIQNEFLLPPFDTLEPVQQPTYTQAKLEFINSKWAGLEIGHEATETDKNAYAILSSGGKDSLLSYGMVKEFGTPHPIFINESGRHWFTAVNAHRHFEAIEPNTAKPWCNSDRLFNWMLRQLKFIRPNHAAIRSDMYPIRLWTVAVFLFGVLPIVRKRKIGNILIGNEYDTTLRANTQGISHYCALYDQSKYFDNALTRYYHQKKWAVNQFSILRSLSELLIMKVLIKRYPELQKHQVSCHAAHAKDGRMYPCGNCEKCRRIIGMITALDENPANCGYTPEQIAGALKALSAKKVKQIGSDAAHLYHLLLSKGQIAETEFTGKVARAHPEIMKLRFDQERSNLQDLPEYVRMPLFNIVRQYADGAVSRREKRWVEENLTEDFILASKYKYHE
ncbi:MAG: hypothetical protein KDC44_20095 [Phaeodactylibacter sp.]|nr:hypothetical protein [Phaeodactylibacter sp.]